MAINMRSINRINSVCDKCGFINGFSRPKLQEILEYHNLGNLGKIYEKWNKHEDTGYILLSYDDLKDYSNVQYAVSDMLDCPEDYMYFVSIYTEGLYGKCLSCGSKISIEVNREYTVHCGKLNDINRLNIEKFIDSTEEVDSINNVTLCIFKS